jgi:hypothetical protein
MGRADEFCALDVVPRQRVEDVQGATHSLVSRVTSIIHVFAMSARPSTATTFGRFDDRELDDQTRCDGDGGAGQPVVAVGQQHCDPVGDRGGDVPESQYVVSHAAQSMDGRVARDWPHCPRILAVRLAHAGRGVGTIAACGIGGRLVRDDCGVFPPAAPHSARRLYGLLAGGSPAMGRGRPR